ncbi:hypothetical protein [Verrucosispora sp. TAA-831]
MTLRPHRPPFWVVTPHIVGAFTASSQAGMAIAIDADQARLMRSSVMR